MYVMMICQSEHVKFVLRSDFCVFSQECGQLREEVQQLYQKLSETTQKIIELESYIRHQQQLAEAVQKKHAQELQAFQEKFDRYYQLI